MNPRTNLTSWYSVVLQNLVVTCLVKEILCFMVTVDSLPRKHNLGTVLYSNPVPSCPYSPTLFLQVQSL